MFLTAPSDGCECASESHAQKSRHASAALP
jgi:hypothetical protein